MRRFAKRSVEDHPKEVASWVCEGCVGCERSEPPGFSWRRR